MTIRIIRVNLATMVEVALLGVKLLQLSSWQHSPTQAWYIYFFLASLHAFSIFGQVLLSTAVRTQPLEMWTVLLISKYTVIQYPAVQFIVFFGSHFCSAFGLADEYEHFWHVRAFPKTTNRRKLTVWWTILRTEGRPGEGQNCFWCNHPLSGFDPPSS